MLTTPSFESTTQTSTTTAKSSRLMIDAPTRMFHWLFALSFLGAYLTADGERWRSLHVTLGYTLAGLLGFRVLYGIFGPREVCLSAMWRRLSGTPTWLKSLTISKTPASINWRQGQNLLMALAVVALLVIVVPLTLSGYGAYNDWGDFLGGDWISELHEFFGEAFLVVVLAHLGFILGLSVLRRKNQAMPMLTGRVKGSGPNLVQKNRVWLAVMLLLAVLAYTSWEWQQSPNGLIPVNAFSNIEADRGHRDD